MASKKRPKKTIGSLEEVAFPDFNLNHVHAKVDTGAYTSTIHCYQIHERERNGQKWLHIKFLDHSHPDYNKAGQDIYQYTKARVRSSSGHLESRFKVKLKVKLGRKIYKTEFTLSNRSRMKYPVLLGRRLLLDRFVVDVSKKYLLSEKGAPRKNS